jgi:hypothetical protein
VGLITHLHFTLRLRVTLNGLQDKSYTLPLLKDALSISYVASVQVGVDLER